MGANGSEGAFGFRDYQNRPTLHGLAIDPDGTNRPENFLKSLGTSNEHGHSIFGAGVIDSGILDPRGLTILAAARAIDRRSRTPFIPPLVVQRFHFGQRRHMPSFSIIGPMDFKAGRFERGVKPEFTVSHPTLFTPGDPDLHRKSAFQEAMQAAAKHRNFSSAAEQTQAGRELQARETVHFFARAFNLALTRFAVQNKVPILTRQYPFVAEDETGEFEMSGVSATPTPHKAFGNEFYGKFSSPSTHPEAWANIVNVTAFMRRGRTAFDAAVAHSIARHLHANRERLIRSRRTHQRKVA